MKTVVITGSARGFGFELAKCFYEKGFNIVLSDINKTNLEKAKSMLDQNKVNKVISITCDVTKRSDVENLWNEACNVFNTIDIWINNAGVNQPRKNAWDLSEKDINFLVDVDLIGTINGSTVASFNMIKQGFGAIYNVEGFGSNDAYQNYLVMYGTTKRAVTYYTIALSKELKNFEKNIIVGRLAPGIMITDFLTSSNGEDENVVLDEKTKKVYNILGDYPDVIAKYLTKKMIKNKKSNVQLSWLTNGKAFRRFFFSFLNKRDFFKNEK